MKRSEHPNPQFERDGFLNLNGEWDFGFSYEGRSFRLSEEKNRAEEIREKGVYTHKINIPFCPQSVLSGVGYTDFINLAWYRRTVDINKNDRLVTLNIGAADYITSVLVNGRRVGTHIGGYTPFSFDITEFVWDGENEIFILCEDSERDPSVPRGKQSEKKQSHGCDYTRTTGIWQTVYLEYIPKENIRQIKMYPNIDDCSLTFYAEFDGEAPFSCDVFYEDRCVGSISRPREKGKRYFDIPLSEKHLWEVGNGRLYTIVLHFGSDTVKSYFGLREVKLDGFRFLLNGKSVFQRLVLDQGFYKDGIYTAPDEEAMINDIKISMECGFNGARLHQKVFEPRFLYHCDRLGYLVWGEYASWGIDHSDPRYVTEYISQWAEAVERDFNHPSIIGWCPFNETWNYKGKKQFDGYLSAAYRFTKSVDRTRPCIDTSGNFHVVTDIYDVHDYSFDTEFFRKNYDRLMTDGELYEHVLKDNPGRQKYGGEPVFISEYGGIKWVSDESVKSWGYGEDVKTEEEFLERYKGLTEAILKNSKILGFCYTQLYDIEQEQNGLFTYERKKKFTDEIYEKIREVNTQTAEIEK